MKTPNYIFLRARLQSRRRLHHFGDCGARERDVGEAVPNECTPLHEAAARGAIGLVRPQAPRLQLAAAAPRTACTLRAHALWREKGNGKSRTR